MYEVLVASGADVDLAGKNEITPLLAGPCKNYETFELLIYAGADVNAMISNLFKHGEYKTVLFIMFFGPEVQRRLVYF